MVDKWAQSSYSVNFHAVMVGEGIDGRRFHLGNREGEAEQGHSGSGSCTDHASELISKEPY